MAIYFAEFRARPGEHLPESTETGGAYINCWIKADSAAEAQKLASAFITSEGWIVESVEHEARLIIEPDEESRERFEQAQVDGECYVFHKWPVGDRNEESLH
jgi:hypothetical protein